MNLISIEYRSAAVRSLQAMLGISVLCLSCSVRPAPHTEDLATVETRLNYMRELPQVAWVDRHPPATIVIGWKEQGPDFGALNRAAATKASQVTSGVRIVSVRDFQRSMWQQVTPICESTTTSGTPPFDSNCQ